MGVIAELMVAVGADVRSFTTKMREVDAKLDESSAKSGKFGSSFAGGGLLIAGALTGIVGIGIAAAEKTAAVGQAAYQMGEKFGLAGTQASAWLTVARHLGIDSDQLGSGFKFLSKNVEGMNLAMMTHVADSRTVIEASEKLKLSQDHYNQTLKAFGPHSDKTLTSMLSLQQEQDRYNKITGATTTLLGPTAQAFGVLGLNAFDSAGKMKSANELMLEAADAFAKMPDGIEKTGLAIKVFGKQGMEMLPVLNLGRKGLEDMMAAGKKTGEVMSNDQVAAAHKLFLEQQRLNSGIAGVTTQLGTMLLPILIAGIPIAMGLVGAIGHLGDHMDIILPILGGLVGAFLLWKATMMAMGIASFIGTVVGLGSAFVVTAAEEGVLNAVMALNPIGLVVVAVALLIAGLALLVTHWKQVVSWVTNAWNSLGAWRVAIMIAGGPLTGFIAMLILVVTHFGHIVDAIKGVITWIGNMARAFANSGLVKDIGAVAGVAHTLHIPGFQFGGTVPGPYLGAPSLIMAHAGEMVTPPGRGVGGGTDMTEVIRILRDILAAATAQPTGQTGVAAALYRAMQGAGMNRLRGMAGA